MFFFGLVLAILLVCLAWRLACNYRSIPWPSWLWWWLENPYMIVFCPPKWLVEHLELEPGMRVLEVGSGAGRVSRSILGCIGPLGQLVAIDLQQSMMEILKSRLSEDQKKQCRFHVIDFTKEDIEEKDFDRALLTTVLGELPRREQSLAKIFQKLKPGGQLLITEVIPDPCYVTFSQLIKLCDAAGFKLLDQKKNLVAYSARFRKPFSHEDA